MSSARLATEETRRPDHENHQDDDEANGETISRSQREHCELLHDADGEGTDHRAGDAPKPTQHRRSEHREKYSTAEQGIDGRIQADERSTDAAQPTADCDRDERDKARIDSLQASQVWIVGNRTHGAAKAREGQECPDCQHDRHREDEVGDLLRADPDRPNDEIASQWKIERSQVIPEPEAYEVFNDH